MKLTFLYSYGEEGINLLPINFFEIFLYVLAILIFIITVITANILLKKNKVKIGIKKKFNIILPFLIGFLVLFFLINKSYYLYIVPFALLAYGIALFNLNRFTNSNLKILVAAIFILSIIAFLTNYSLIILALGLGVFPIIFGLYLNKIQKG
jgi:hypothetical protein